ncbi:MAG: hypothetical protein HUJ55_05150 [Ileibacterium sp.]|nr:hypothetical protein [Ileibacterium sp.]
MTKEEFTNALKAAVGGTEYGDEIIADLTAHFDETGKYAQTAKDRLDERIATLKGWEKKHAAEGNADAAAAEAAKVAIAEKALAAIE